MGTMSPGGTVEKLCADQFGTQCSGAEAVWVGGVYFLQEFVFLSMNKGL